MEIVGIYIFYTFDKIVTFFPGIDFSTFSDFEKLMTVLTVNMFYCLFLFFMIWCIVKFAYFGKNFLSQFM